MKSLNEAVTTIAEMEGRAILKDSECRKWITGKQGKEINKQE